MIPVSETTVDSLIQKDGTQLAVSWQKQVSDSFSNVTELLDYLKLSENTLPYQIDRSQPFKLKVTRFFADLIKPSDPFDPLLLQVLPLTQENEHHELYSDDPLEESQFSPTSGLIHKYSSRALLIAHQACAVHCRYCFRRHFPYEDQRLSKTALEEALAEIQNHPDINEVILSGGDPLSLSDQKLADLLLKLDSIEQISTIRIHTRTPVMAPERVSEALLHLIDGLTKRVVMVLHINHAQEISLPLRHKLQTLSQRGVTLLNQSVLLKGVNDNVPALISLSHSLFACNILPYYLHLLDKTKGTHHFMVEDDKAKHLWLELQKNVAGYLVPRLAREIPGKSSKTWIIPS